MLDIRLISVAMVSVFAVVSSVEAKDWKPVPSSWTSGEYRISEYTVKATATGCEGSQSYEKIGNPSDKGVARLAWASVSKKYHGTLCSRGTWYQGGGPNAGQAGGHESDVLIKNGKFYR
jgi:hypothetical protein